MKKVILILVTILAILIGILAFAMNGSENAATLYKKAPHVNYSQLLDDISGKNLYYFYQSDCIHCNNIKGDIADFYFNEKPSDVDFYLVDGASKENKAVWTSDEEELVKSGRVNDFSEIKIQGTPTLIEIEDGTIKQFLVGETQIPEYLSSYSA